MPYQPPVYRRYLEDAGYRKARDLYAWNVQLRDDIGPADAALLDRIRQRLRVDIRPVDVRHLDRELTTMLEIYSRAWKDNWGFVPATPREARHTVALLRHLVDPRFVLSADIDGRPVGFLVALPDINQALKGTSGRLLPFGLLRLLRRRQLIDQWRLLLLGILPEYRQTGLYFLMLAALRDASRQVSWRRLELSWILEDNFKVNSYAEAVGAVRYKTYRIYEKPLTAERGSDENR
jgi:hypothetical protein